MESIANDPDRVVPAPGNQTCLSRVIFPNDLRTGQPVRQQIMVMFIAVDVDTYLTADHGGGVNAVRRLTLVHDARGARFVEERGEIPPVEPLPNGSYRWSADPGTSGG